jgi:uncharacterized protein YidB (DUF937 family)
MDLSNLLQLGAMAIQKNSDQATTGIDTNQLVSALGALFGGGSDKLDFASLISKMQQSGLGDIAASWLSNGSNLPISADSITDLVGPDKIASFAAQFGLSGESAKNAIASALPEMVDKASPEGSLLEGIVGNLGNLGDLGGGLSDIVKKLF